MIQIVWQCLPHFKISCFKSSTTSRMSRYPYSDQESVVRPFDRRVNISCFHCLLLQHTRSHYPYIQWPSLTSCKKKKKNKKKTKKKKTKKKTNNNKSVSSTFNHSFSDVLTTTNKQRINHTILSITMSCVYGIASWYLINHPLTWLTHESNQINLSIKNCATISWQH